MSTAPGLMTADELWKLPNTGMRRELVRGELRTMAPAGFEHGRIETTLTLKLAEHVRDSKPGDVVVGDTGFVLARDPDLMRAPHAAFVSQARLEQTGIPKHFFPGPPDLAIEIVSPSDTLYEIDEKVDDYLTAGTRLVWVINPRRRTVTLHRPGGQPVVLREADQLTGEDVVPGFTCRVSSLFGTP